MAADTTGPRARLGCVPGDGAEKVVVVIGNIVLPVLMAREGMIAFRAF